MKSRKPVEGEALPQVNPEFVLDTPKAKRPYKPFDYPKSEYRDPREGWECPRCGTCWSPDIPRCDCIADEPIPDPKVEAPENVYITEGYQAQPRERIKK